VSLTCNFPRQHRLDKTQAISENKTSLGRPFNLCRLICNVTTTIVLVQCILGWTDPLNLSAYRDRCMLLNLNSLGSRWNAFCAMLTCDVIEGLILL
jgi:hypothetical protein